METTTINHYPAHSTVYYADVHKGKIREAKVIAIQLPLFEDKSIFEYHLSSPNGFDLPPMRNSEVFAHFEDADAYLDKLLEKEANEATT